MSDWKHKDEWKRYGKDFLVSVTRHSVAVDEHGFYDSDLGHRWCVYAYIYPKHPHFAKFDGPQMYQDAASCMPFHGGPSLLEYPMYDGAVTSVKVGCDYNHLHDWPYTRMANKEEALGVFADADELYNWLQERSK